MRKQSQGVQWKGLAKAHVRPLQLWIAKYRISSSIRSNLKDVPVNEKPHEELSL